LPVAVLHDERRRRCPRSTRVAGSGDWRSSAGASAGIHTRHQRRL
jgi:hypothetical protein